MQQQIATVNSTMEVFSQAKTSRKRKRHEMSESECSEQEDTAMAGNPTDISNEVDDLLQTAASKKALQNRRVWSPRRTYQIYDSEGTVSDQQNENMRNTTDQKTVKTL